MTSSCFSEKELKDESALFKLIIPQLCGTVFECLVKRVSTFVIADRAKLFKMLQSLDTVKEFNFKTAALGTLDLADIEKIELFRSE